jgi:hypothetical protein
VVGRQGGDKDRQGQGEWWGQGQTTQDHTRLQTRKEWSTFLPPHFVSLTFFFSSRHNSFFFVSNTYFYLSLGLVFFFFPLYVAECGEITTFAFNFQVFAFSFLFFFSCGW